MKNAVDVGRRMERETLVLAQMWHGAGGAWRHTGSQCHPSPRPGVYWVGPSGRLLGRIPSLLPEVSGVGGC